MADGRTDETAAGGKVVGTVTTADEQRKVVKGIATNKMKITDQDKQPDIEQGGG